MPARGTVFTTYASAISRSSPVEAFGPAHENVVFYMNTGEGFITESSDITRIVFRNGLFHNDSEFNAPFRMEPLNAEPFPVPGRTYYLNDGSGVATPIVFNRQANGGMTGEIQRQPEQNTEF